MDQVEAVRAAVRIEDVAGRYTSLRKAGARLSGCCPVHDEKTPSFVVSPDRGTWHCFGCGAHGDAIDLLMAKEKVGFQQAVELLARDAGVALKDQAQAPQPGAALARDEQLAALAWAADWFVAQLCEEARAYLAGRGLSDQTLASFRVGWAPGDGQLVRAARAAGHRDLVLLAAGLALEREGQVRDAMWRRVVVPVLDDRGRVIAFTARALPIDVERAEAAGKHCPKYVNTAETPVFSKGATVFGLSRVRTADEAKPVLLVEGAMDALAVQQGGFGSAIAPLGTALTAAQAQAIARVLGRRELVLCLDGDRAGIAATKKAAPLLLAAGIRLRIASLRGGEGKADPASLLIEGGDHARADGKVILQQAITHAEKGLAWWLALLAPAPQALDDQQRLDVFDQVAAVIGALPDADQRRLAAKHAGAWLHLDSSTALRRLERAHPAASDHSAAGAKPPGGPGAQATATDDSIWRPRFELNELGNAERLRTCSGDDVRFVRTWGTWLVWIGTHWVADDQTLRLEALMADAIGRTCDEDLAAIDAEQTARIKAGRGPSRVLADHADDIAKWRVKNRNDRAICNSVHRARAVAALQLEAEQLDANAWVLSVANGTIDLTTGVLRPHDRADLITRCGAIAYDPTARDDVWDSLVDHLTAEVDDPAGMRAYLARAAGYTLSGSTREAAVFMVGGGGGTGKTTLVAAMQSVLGDYARVLPFETFLSANTDRKPWELAECSQARMVVCEESDDGKRFNASLVKGVSGGAHISAQRKGGHPFQYRPKFKVWFVTNNLPYVSDTDDGFWRRAHTLRFEKKFGEGTRKDAQTHLTQDPAARAAVLAWAVAGALDYHQAGGLNPPAHVLIANSTYRDEQDPLRDWISEHACFDAEATTAIRVLYDDYRTYAKDRGLREISHKSFGTRMQAKGAVAGPDVWTSHTDPVTGSTRSVRAYHGVRLRRDSDPIPRPEIVASDSPQIRLRSASDPKPEAIRTPAAPTAAQSLRSTQAGSIPTPAGIASDHPIASDSPQIISPIGGDAVPGPIHDLRQIASDTSDFSIPHAHAHAHPRVRENYPLPDKSHMEGLRIPEIGGDQSAPPPRPPQPPAGPTLDDLTSSPF